MTREKEPLESQTITPYFTVQNADKLIDFAVATFGATLFRENRYEDGRLQHARLQIGNSVIMLNESSDDDPINTSQMHVYVDDADRIYALALELGAISLMEPNIRPHGDRMAGIKDLSLIHI